MIQYILVACIAFLAYLVKGLTGFGPAIVFISLGSLVMNPIQVVGVSPLLDIVAGSILIWKDRSYKDASYWLTLSVPLLAGVMAGSIGLRFATADLYQRILGGAVFILGAWFLFRSNPEKGNDGDRLLKSLPTKPAKAAMIIAVFSGISGGLFGISGPPLIYYFGTRFQRQAFRKAIVPLFLVEASGRSLTYVSLGMMRTPELTLAVILVPFLLAGLAVGNHWFNLIPQSKFERVIGVILIVSGAKLIF